MATIPLSVRTFLEGLYEKILRRDADGVKRLYETDFKTLTETHFPDSRWVSDRDVEEYYRKLGYTDYDVVLCLYRELYHRHLLEKRIPDIQWSDRHDANLNYHLLLEYFISEECSPSNLQKLVLPSQWIWDIVDEFVYQYQDAQLWKSRQAREARESPSLICAVEHGKDAWRTYDVLYFLNAIVKASNIHQFLTLQNQRNYRAPMKRPYDFQILLGYFAVVALMKLHISMGDYRTALKIVDCIELSAGALYWEVPACYVTLFYNLGFCYMMMRRYHDATRILSEILTFLTKNKPYLFSLSYQKDAMTKITDKMYQLLMLCSVLSPARLDESLQLYMQDKWADRYLKLQSDEEEAFREVFTKSCPRFFHPFTSDYKDPNTFTHVDPEEPLNRQLEIFLKDVQYQNKVFNVRSIAKLYNNMTLKKLANLMNMTEEEEDADLVRAEMLCVKNRAEQIVWVSGPLSSGEKMHMLPDLDICLENDTIHVKNIMSKKSYVNQFFQQICATQDCINVLCGKATGVRS